MNDLVADIPNLVDCLTVESLRNYLVWRYVKEEHREDEDFVSSICFCLTETDNGHVSFSHSNEENVFDMVKKVHKTIRVGGKTKPALYLSIDIKEAYEEINKPNDLITFKTCGYPHVGLYYLDYSDLSERNLIIASLVELSETYYRDEGGDVRKCN